MSRSLLANCHWLACQRFFSQTTIRLEDGLGVDHASSSPVRKARDTMRELQAAQVAAALILRARMPVGALRLTKLMYLVEREAMKRSVFPIVGDDICAMQMGMGLSRTYNLMIEKPDTPTTGEWGKHIERTPKGLTVSKGIGESALTGLSANDVKVIDEVWREYGSKSNDELIHEVHHGLREWKAHWESEDRRRASVKVPYEVLFKLLCGMSDADAEDAAAEVAYFQAITDWDGMQAVA